MEDLDRRIVGLLLQDGRMSFTDLGKVTGLSTSAVHQRVRRLEGRGVIQGYRAVVDYNALGMPLVAFISVTPTDPAAPDDVPDRLRDMADIEACHSVAGEESYILKARVSTPASSRIFSPGYELRPWCRHIRRWCSRLPGRSVRTLLTGSMTDLQN